MNKEVVINVIGKVLVGVDRVITAAAIGGGTYVVLDAVSKRYSPRMLKQAARLSLENGLKEGEIQEIFRADIGIPFLVGSFFTDVAMYIVVKIKDDGKYKMRYIGARGFTKQEAEDYYIIL